MIKYLFVLLNTVGVLSFGLYLGKEVTIRHNIPEEAAPGSEFTVDFEIDKAEISGFAKLQLELPADIEVEAVEKKGASFTFSDQRVKLIWFKLPDESVFTISLKFKLGPTVTGDQVIAGKFSFLHENDRKFEEVVPQTIKVFSGAVVQQNEITSGTDNGSTAETSNGTTSTGTTSTSTETSTPLVVPAVQIADPVSVKRTVTPKGKNEWMVELTIKKGNNSGTATLLDNFPAFGFDAIQTKGKGTAFTFNKKIGRVSFVWDALPADEEILVAYHLILKDQMMKGTKNIIGNFEYAIDGNKATEAIYASSITIQASEVAEVTPPKPTPTPKPKPTPKPTPKPKATNNNSRALATNAKGISYRVQIAAGHNSVKNSYFKDVHGFSGRYVIEHHEGWIKYTTGSFTTYKDSRNKREELNAGGYDFPGPFVASYNNGTRITVQEALMVTNQKWVQ